MPYHITARCINREWFSTSPERNWEIFSRNLYLLHHGFDILIHAFVMMSNHYHLLASAPRLNMSEGMAYFNRESSRDLTRESQRINRAFAGRFFRSRIGNPHYFLNCYKYVYKNPVKAGLADNCEVYPYSTLSGLLGRQRLLIPVAHDDTLFGDVEGTLAWLNQPVDEGDWDAVRRALRRREFQLAKDRSFRRMHRLEYALL